MREVKDRWDEVLLDNPSKDVQGTRDELNNILSALKQDDSGGDPDGEVAIRWAQSIMQAIAPMKLSQLFGKRERDGQDEGQDAADDPHVAVSARSQIVAEAGLEIVSLLQVRQPQSVSYRPDADALLTMAALAARDNPWVSGHGTSIAKDILQHEVGQFGRDDSASAWVADSVLSYLRQTFSRSKPAGVTVSGRPSAYGDEAAAEHGLPDESAATKPWKYADYRAVSILHWILQNADEPFMRNHCRSLVPPLLTLGEDSSTHIRSSGIRLIHLWIKTTPINIARTSGLLLVFEENVLVPSLGYLPSLTPEAESVQLVEPSLEALLTLCERIGDRSSGEWGRVADKIFRQGILSAYHHVAGGGRYPRLVEVLVRQMGRVVEYLGVHAVKYLKDLVPMLSDVIRDVTEPLARDDGLLLAAVSTLGVTLRKCHVRIVVNEGYVDEIVKMICLAWLHTEDKGDEGTREGDEGMKKIRELLQGVASDLFTYASQKEVDLHSRVGKLIEIEPTFRDLFPTGVSNGPSS